MLSRVQVGLNNLFFFCQDMCISNKILPIFLVIHCSRFILVNLMRWKWFYQRTCRLEKVNLRKFHSVAKVIGTVITVSGAMVMTLYKGPAFQIIKGGGAMSHHSNSSSTSTTEPSDQHWIVGTVYLISSCASWAGFFILQVSIIFFNLWKKINNMWREDLWGRYSLRPCNNFSVMQVSTYI